MSQQGRITSPLPTNFSCNIRFGYDTQKRTFRAELQQKSVGIKDYRTVLNDEETMTILALVVQASNGELVFDPQPTNFITVYKEGITKAKQQEQTDTETLESQTATIEGLRVELEAAQRASQNAVERIRDLTEELKVARGQAAPTQPPPPPTEPVNPPITTPDPPVTAPAEGQAPPVIPETPPETPPAQQ